MTDLPSAGARLRVAEKAAPYFVRIDVPIGADRPDTWTKEAGSQDVAACVAFCLDSLAERGVASDTTVDTLDPVTHTSRSLETFTNVQVRIWHRPTDEPKADLVFDRTCLPWAVPDVLAEFAAVPTHHALPPLSDKARESQLALGGPFESEHALLTAVAQRAGGQPDQSQ